MCFASYTRKTCVRRRFTNGIPKFGLQDSPRTDVRYADCTVVGMTGRDSPHTEVRYDDCAVVGMTARDSPRTNVRFDDCAVVGVTGRDSIRI